MQSIESSLFLTNDTNFSSLTQFNELDTCSYYYEKLKIELYDNATGKLLKTVTLAENTDKISYYNTTNYDLNLKIKVILTEYKDSESVNSIGVISHLIRDILPTETLTINGTLDQLTRVNYLSSNNELLYRINANEFSYYVFEASSEKPIYIYLYDSEFNLLNASPCVTVNGSLYFSEYLSNDVVYIKIKFESIRDTGNVNVLIRQETYKQVWFNSESDLLPYLHEHLNDLMAHGYYINYQNAGFYEVELYAENSDGQIYDLPYGAITIKDNNDEYIINKYEFDEFSTVAKNSDGNNSLIVYLPRSGYFYFHISLPLDDYANLKIKIKPIENESINLFELPENMNDEERQRLVPVFWADSIDSNFQVNVCLTANDRSSLLADVTMAIGEFKLYLNSLNARTGKNNVAIIEMTLEIKNMEQLDKVIKSLMKVEGVISVTRRKQ